MKDEVAMEVSMAAAERSPHGLPLSGREISIGSSKTAARGWQAILASQAAIGLLTIACVWIAPVVTETNLTETNLAILYSFAVVCNALLWGRRAAILSAISGALLFDLLFMPADSGFAVGDLRYLIAPAGLITVGLIVSKWTITAREHRCGAGLREADIASLYSLTKSLAEENELDRILDEILRHVIRTFRRPVALFLPGAAPNSRLISPGLVPETSIAAWVFEHGEEAGCGTAQFPDSRIRYQPMKTWQGVVGVLGVLAGNRKGLLLRNRQELLNAFMNQAALAITRANLAGKAQRTELLLDSDKLQKALLNSVSHDLRTPLVSVIGGLNSVLHDSALLDASTQRTLLQTARDEAVGLNRLIQNLLDMTRLEGGAILAKTQPCDVQDVVGAALEQLGEAAHNRPISIQIEPSLPPVPMDHALIVQVLVNLLDNALKYSPFDSPIEIDAALGHDEVRIRIANSGKEIPPQELDRVFDKFYRGTSTGGARGVGLGLSICKGFVEVHHGRICAEPRPRGGIGITFSLPLASKQ
jgi:two-component system sensor histidine kinase KdpD